MRRNPAVPTRLSRLRLPALCLAALLQVLPCATLQALADSEATLAAAAATGAPAGAMAEVLRGGNFPLTVKASELTSEWRQVTFGRRPVPLVDSIDATVRSIAQKSAWHYTKGETFSSSGETYLLAYRQPLEPVRDNSDEANEDLMRLERGLGAYRSTRLRPDAVLSLSLINLHAVGNINDIRAFDPERDIISVEEENLERSIRNNRQSLSNLRQLGMGLMMYAQDYDEKLPPMRSANSMAQIKRGAGGKDGDTVQQLLQHYVTRADIFVHPGTRAIYRPNTALSRRRLSDIKAPVQVITFFEAKAAPDGTRGVVFLDGHAKRVAESDWEGILAESEAGLAASATGSQPSKSPAPARVAEEDDSPPPSAKPLSARPAAALQRPGPPPASATRTRAASTSPRPKAEAAGKPSAPKKKVAAPIPKKTARPASKPAND